MLTKNNSLPPTNTGIHTRPHSLPIAAWNSSYDITRHDHNVQPDLVKDVLVPNPNKKSNNGQPRAANGTITKLNKLSRFGIRASKIKTIKSDNDLVNIRRSLMRASCRSSGESRSNSAGEHCDQRSSTGSAKADRLHNKNNNNSNSNNNTQLCSRCSKKRSIFSRSCIAQQLDLQLIVHVSFTAEPIFFQYLY